MNEHPTATYLQHYEIIVFSVYDLGMYGAFGTDAL